MKKYSTIYKNNLLNNVIPFWESNSIDTKFPGYLTCLDKNGNVFDTDKFVWLQGRQAWIFSLLYDEIEQKQAWKEIARHGIDFLVKNGMDENGFFYFSTDRSGKPLIQPYNIFSDCFATMAFARYSKITGDPQIRNLAVQTFHHIISRKEKPKRHFEKSTGNRALKSFALPMILSNLVLELEDLIPQNLIEDTISESIQEVMNVFLNKDNGLIYEHVKPDGTNEDSFNGRLLNPGHGLEAMWFMIDLARRNNDKNLIQTAKNTILRILDHSWDENYKGIYYFMDAHGKPPQQLEWDQKLWWVHLEALVAVLKAYEQLPCVQLRNWFEKLHNYVWNHFPDKENGEWFGYLNRRGEVLLDLKGGKWKGCFHVPRGLFQCWKTLEAIEQKENNFIYEK